MSLKLNSSGGGSITLQEPSTASNRTLTLPDNNGNLISSADSGTITQGMLASGVAGNGPAFSAYLGTNQTVTQSVWTKLQINTEEFDTNNCYDNSTNYRFTPNIAGYYQVTGNAVVTNANQQYNQLAIYKNGSLFKAGTNNSAVGAYWFMVSALVYLNGSTDYIELYGQTTGAVPTFSSGQTSTYFQAALVRAA